MNANRIMLALRDHLTALAKPDGVVTVEADPAGAVVALEAHSPRKWAVCLVWSGFGGQPDGDLDTWQDHNLSAFVRCARGLDAVAGKSLLQATGGREMSILEIIEWVRLAIVTTDLQDRRGAKSIDQRGFRLTGSDWWRREDGALTDVHELKFSLAAAVDVAAERVTVEA